MEQSPHFKPAQSALLLIEHQVGNRTTPQGMALVPLLASDPPMWPVY